MLIYALIALDIFSSIVMMFKLKILLLPLSFLMLAKGGMTLIPAIASGVYFDLMGYIDFISGLLLFLWLNGFYTSIIPIVGLFLFFKGVFSFLAVRG